ncbi:MAG: ATP-binding protein [Candidatus Electrothrix aestuarii]|uniref:ATP-binding protein n=1 Tax=Candidatus Electrothrix aestuarii TaxID=3062594 RepID=A0AAU8LX31_9BACT|nr:ATP-binding protein [Candidatus Electrothrix aestuarii]
MIISFSLENWMSFRDPVTFSMLATEERRHRGRIAKLGKYQTKVLPIAAVYGGNASGKSNLFKALNFAKSLVVNITQLDEAIPVQTFCLDADRADQPARFAFELLIDEVIYDFSFAVTGTAVVEEQLVKITGEQEEVLYSRPGRPPEAPSLQVVFHGTRDNQLFLTNSVSQKVSAFRPVYDWFKDTLKLVSPDSSPGLLSTVLNGPLSHTMNELLQQLDTGIVDMSGEEVPLEHISFSLPDTLKHEIQKNLKEGATATVRDPLSQTGGLTILFVTRKGEKLIAKKLMTSHRKTDGTEAKFEMHQESDGTLRVIELLPVFLDLSDNTSNRVYVIDEIDRSLHTLLTRRLLQGYLDGCSAKTRSQLLLTTHDVLLMDKELLRHDEMWVTERDAAGASTLFSFSEYKEADKDKDIRKSYLQGRLGGIPHILLHSPLQHSGTEEAE